MIKDIFVDFDGTLISNYFEEELYRYQKDNNLSYDNSSSLWDWYAKLIDNNTEQVLNINLLNQLIAIKEEYYVNIHLWTNRQYDLMKATKKTLGSYIYVFDSFNFYAGDKANSSIEGLILDNDSKYFINNNPGILINF